jgi:hypothetical protein
MECFTVKKIERRAYPKSMSSNILPTVHLSFSCANFSNNTKDFPIYSQVI